MRRAHERKYTEFSYLDTEKVGNSVSKHAYKYWIFVFGYRETRRFRFSLSGSILNARISIQKIPTNPYFNMRKYTEWSYFYTESSDKSVFEKYGNKRWGPYTRVPIRTHRTFRISISQSPFFPVFALEYGKKRRKKIPYWRPFFAVFWDNLPSAMIS